MSKLKFALVAIALTTSVISATGVAADASPNVTIHKIANRTIEEDATTSIRPKVTQGTRVKVTSKLITVKEGGTTVVNRKSSARLEAGTYRVTTSVAFKTWKSTSGKSRKYSSVRHKSKTQTLEIQTEQGEEQQPAEDVPAEVPETQHECTRTSSGTCIAGGQFCPKAKYGQSGWDAAGRLYICSGDSDHPHWM